MKDTKYWSIIGKEKCSDGVWRFTHQLEHSSFRHFCTTKILDEDRAHLTMRILKVAIESQDCLSAKLGKIHNRNIAEDVFCKSVFDIGDYMVNDEYSECIQVKRWSYPNAVFYCIPLYHKPNVNGSMRH